MEKGYEWCRPHDFKPRCQLWWSLSPHSRVQAISKDGQSSKSLVARISILNPSCGSIEPLVAAKEGRKKADMFGNKSMKVAAGMTFTRRLCRKPLPLGMRLRSV